MADIFNSNKSEGRIKIAAPSVHNSHGAWFLPGAGKTEWFKDIEAGPEMVVVPAGIFMMGSAPAEIEGLCKEYNEDAEFFEWEAPQHKVDFAEPFAVGRYAVTCGEFSVFVNETGHDMSGGAYVFPSKEREIDASASWPFFAEDDNHPVVCVNWDHAKTYANWLSGKTGKDYRLLSEAEWEYACRAGTQTPFWWGASISTDQANYDGNYTFGGGRKGEYREKAVPVQSFQPNPWGLYQVHGNVWEWCEDCWNDTYKGAPGDGSAWTTGRSHLRVLRGGSWGSDPRDLRAAVRYVNSTAIRNSLVGFRLARTL